MLSRLKTALRALLRRSHVERELDEELHHHIERQIEQNIRMGMNREEARYAARMAFGGVEQAKERSRDARGVRWAEELWQDMRYGGRTLRRSPGWTAVCGATLSLGIGLTTAIFSLTYSVLLRPLPYPDTARLVAIQLTHTISSGVLRFNVNAANWLEWRAQSTSFEDIALARTGVNFNLTGDGSPERVRGARASSNLAKVLGLHPRFGRTFTEEEVQQDARVVLLSDGYWQRRYAGDPTIVGRRIQLDGEAFQVIGVLPPEFRYPTNDFDLLAPLFIPPDETRSAVHWYYKALGRLKPGVSL